MEQQANGTNRYRIISRLCSGGMADIFLGVQVDQQVFDRLVVIKKVHSIDSSDSDTTRMFADEARIISTLSHPHVVQIFDFAEDADSFILVMEYIDGENLGFILNELRRRSTTMPLSIVFRLMNQVLEALQYIHTARSRSGEPLNIVHRDLDPRNLMVDSNGYLKIIDFGVAKAVVQTELTAPGLFKGKLSHVAPEIFTQSDIDHRADIYSIGLVLFEMAVGRKPYRFGKSPVLVDTIKKIVDDPIPNPSELNPDLPEGLEEIILRACEKNREARYQSAEALQEDLSSYAQEKGINIASNAEVKQWFGENFKQRLATRRVFENQTLQKAKRELADLRPSRPIALSSGQTGIGIISGDPTQSIAGLDTEVAISFNAAPDEAVAQSHVTPISYMSQTTPSAPQQALLSGATAPMPGSHSSYDSLFPAATRTTGTVDAVHLDHDGNRYAPSPRVNHWRTAMLSGLALLAVGGVAWSLLGGTKRESELETAPDSPSTRIKKVGAITVVSSDEPVSKREPSDDTVDEAVDTAPKSIGEPTETQEMAARDQRDPETENASTSRDPEGTASKRSWSGHRSKRPWGRSGRGARKPAPELEPEDMEQTEGTLTPNENEAAAMGETSVAAQVDIDRAEMDDIFVPRVKNAATAKPQPSRAPKPEPAVAPAPAPHAPLSPAPRAPEPEQSAWLSGHGNWNGKTVAQKGCNSCHRAVDAASKTASQWEYFFSHNRHRKHGDLKKLFSKEELGRVESYLVNISEKQNSTRSGIAGVR